MEPIKRNRILEALFREVKDVKPSEWAELHRVMTSDVSAFVGPYRYSKTPYLREIADCASPDHPARKIAIMKGAQIGVSTGVIENIIGWIIDHAPANTLFASGDKELSKEAFETKVDQMIATSGLHRKIGPNVIKKRNQKTGDTSSSKEFPGGRLFARSTQNAKKWKQTSYKYGFVDDFDAAYGADKNEGDLRSLIEQRFNSYAESMKLFYVSTPAVKQTSNIEPAYLMGDQRRYMMPCPCCGVYIPFEWRIKGNDGEFAGVVYEQDEQKQLIEGSVRYRCQECGDEFKEKYKAKMLRLGKWVPTAKPKEPGFYSYHLSALYAAPGMFNWTHYSRQWIEAENSNKKEKLQTFLNVVLGQTWEAQGVAPKSTTISQNTRPYEIGIIPYELSVKDGNGEIVIITCACDLNGKEDDARLDWEICAHSESGSTYSINHGSIGTFKRGKQNDEGRVTYSYRANAANNVWDIFREVIAYPLPTDQGGEMRIALTAVDTGFFTQHAYKFIEQTPSCVGFQGDDKEMFMKLNADNLNFRLSKARNDLYLIRTNSIKDFISENMQQKWDDEGNQPINFMNYPTPAGGKYTVKSYFIEYEGEQRLLDTNKEGTAIAVRWMKKTSTALNHFWDCRVYNMALRDLCSYTVCSSRKVKYPNWQMFCKLMLNK